MKPSKIELDKNRGIEIQLKDGATTQTFTFDGATVTIKVTGPTGMSTIMQTADSVVINCKQFSVIATDSASIMSGPSNVNLTPQSAGLVSPAVSVLGSAQASMLAPTVAITAMTALNMAGPDVQVESATVTMTGAATASVVNTVALMLDGVPL
jgi:hypothetical protein